MDIDNGWFGNLNYSSTVSKIELFISGKNLDMIDLYLLHKHFLAQYSIYRHQFQQSPIRS
jgi:hypothetical protein